MNAVEQAGVPIHKWYSSESESDPELHSPLPVQTPPPELVVRRMQKLFKKQ